MGTRPFFNRTSFVLTLAAAIALAALTSPLLWEGRGLRVDVFDVGQGDAMLVTTPTRERILIDGGPDVTIAAKLSRRLGFFRRTIDLVVVSHPQADHIAGLLPVLDRFTVKRVMLTTIRNETPEYQMLKKKITEHGIPVVDAGEISTLTIGEESPVTLETLWPRREYSGRLVDDPNIVSSVFRLTYGGNRFLFTGDAGEEIERELIRGNADLAADVLKVGHHGSDTSSSDAFLDAVRPSFAVISSGRNNRFGHPSRRVLRRLERVGARIYRTDLMGDIRITSDGKELRVSPQRR